MPDNLDSIGHQAIEHLSLKHAAREEALPMSRRVIRCCANSIRATHRHERASAAELIAQAHQLLSEIESNLQSHQDIYYAGFVHDAQKEYAEAVCFAALTQYQALPGAGELGIGWAAYLNGLAEAAGELRRYLLDQLRRGNLNDCENYLQYMDDIYALLISIDFPDAITSGLRRTTDVTRGILEKTRGDLTTAMRQAQLQHSIHELYQALQQTGPAKQSPEQ
jgi:translin